MSYGSVALALKLRIKLEFQVAFVGAFVGFDGISLPLLFSVFGAGYLVAFLFDNLIRPKPLRYGTYSGSSATG